MGTRCLFTAENSCRKGSVFISDRNKQPSLPFYESSTLFLFGDTTRFAAAVVVLGRLSYFSISTGKMSLSDSFFRGTCASSVPRHPGCLWEWWRKFTVRLQPARHAQNEVEHAPAPQPRLRDPPHSKRLSKAPASDGALENQMTLCLVFTRQDNK